MSKNLTFLAQVEGIEWFPIATMVIYLAFFAGVGYYVFKTKGDRVDRWSRLPLESNDKHEQA